MSFNPFPRCRTQLLGICSTSAVKPVADEEEVLEERWRALCNAFSNKVCQDLKPVNATEAMELEQKLGSLTLKARGSVTSPGDTELPIGEFRQLHSQIATWLSQAEERLKHEAKPRPPSGLGPSKEAEACLLGLEAEATSIRQKLASLKESFNEVSFASEPDLEREVTSGTKVWSLT